MWILLSLPKRQCQSCLSDSLFWSEKKKNCSGFLLVNRTQRAHSAIAGGANRLEVCGNLGLGGGTTPSIGLVKAIKNACPDVPLMVGKLCLHLYGRA